MVEYHMELPSVLQHCQHNGAFRFLAAQVFIDLEPILGPAPMQKPSVLFGKTDIFEF